MIEVKSRTNTLRILAKELHFFDLFRIILYSGYRGDTSKIPRYYKIVRGHSCVTDLRLSMDEILAAMNSTTRRQIRCAEKEGCRFELVADPNEFIPFYNGFCESKGLNDFVSLARLRKYEKVLLTKAVREGVPLAMHATILDERGRVALLMFSCSQRLDAGADRKLIGWANRFLHAKELEYLKSAGYELYDWCGVCLDPNDPRYSIGQFKLSFGGKIIDSWSLMTPLYALLSHLRNKIVKFRK